MLKSKLLNSVVLGAMYLFSPSCSNYEQTPTMQNQAVIETVSQKKSTIIPNLEQMLSFYKENKSPAIKSKVRRNITLNTDYERIKKAEVQLILNGEGFLANHELNGCFDSATVNALKMFQKAKRIEQDGTVGKSTVEQLDKAVTFKLDTKKYILSPDSVCTLDEKDTALVSEIQTALKFHNYLSSDVTGKLDDATVNAIRSYRIKNLLGNNNSIDSYLTSHLSTSSDERSKRLLEAVLALESVDLDKEDVLLMNLPEFRMRYYHGDNLELEMKMIIGSTKDNNRWNTMVQSGRIVKALVNPVWEVPPGDLTKESKKDLSKSPFLRSETEQLINGSWKIIKTGVYGTRFRQVPGPNNPLGRVAYYIGSRYGQLLHGTNNKNLFDYTSRAFSHGCMRLEDEKELFKTFQRVGLIDSSIDLEAAIKTTSKDGKYVSQDINLVNPVDVKITYLRAWIEQDESGLRMIMPPDVYNLKTSKAK